MKNLVIALAATAALTGSAFAADMAPRTYAKAAPMVAAGPSWTGCYLGAGGGGAITKTDHNDYFTVGGAVAGPNLSSGADGWFGTVQVGCDYQFNNWVVGIFGDYDFMDVKGDTSVFGQLDGLITQRLRWSARTIRDVST